jgi:hypothetical protein
MMWLWISGISKDEYNDWIQVLSSRMSTHQQVTFSLAPSKFTNPIINRVVSGRSGNVFLFIEPQTEFNFVDAVFMSTHWNGDTLNVGINFSKRVVSYSGAP